MGVGAKFIEYKSQGRRSQAVSRSYHAGGVYGAAWCRQHCPRAPAFARGLASQTQCGAACSEHKPAKQLLPQRPTRRSASNAQRCAAARAWRAPLCCWPICVARAAMLTCGRPAYWPVDPGLKRPISCTMGCLLLAAAAPATAAAAAADALAGAATVT